MSDTIIVYKPRGKVISKELFARIKKEYTGSRINYIHKVGDEIWKYSSVQTDMKTHEILLSSPDCEFIFTLEKYFAHTNKPMFVHYRPRSDIFDSWFLSCGTGIFNFMTGTNDSVPDILFKNFLQFMNLNSLHSFLNNLCSKNKETSYITIVNGKEVKRYGRWHEVDGIWLSDFSFLHKLEYTAKNAARAIIAFLTKKEEFPQEFKRLESLSDLEIREEAKKVDGLSEILSKIY